MNKKKRIIIALIAGIIMAGNVFIPYNVALAFDENAIKLNISTSNVEVANTWQQIKNAATIHLIAQKMKTCVEIKQTLSPITGNAINDSFNTAYWSRKEVVDDGKVFKGSMIISGDHNTDVAVGPALSSNFTSFGSNNNGSGIIHCNSKTKSGKYLFDMFVYVLKNYRAGMSLAGAASGSVTAADRLSVICNGERPGMLQPVNVPIIGAPTASNEPCNSGNVEYYAGVDYDQQLSYLGSLYENMRANSGNSYILPWSSLDTYNGVDGYYLYNNDFKAQCGDVFTANDYSGARGFRVNDDGSVESGSYSFTNDTARASFVEGTRTCTQLVEEMNDHIGEYLRFVNEQVLSTCEAGVTSAIDEKRREIQEKYLSGDASEEEKSDANSVISEYDRIVSTREYMAVKDGENETLMTAEQMPTDRVWQCRSHLPFVNVTTQHEDSMDELIHDEFDDYCYEVMDLAWVVCPVVRAISDAADGLQEAIGGFFE